jgi:hypothetical protein
LASWLSVAWWPTCRRMRRSPSSLNHKANKPPGDSINDSVKVSCGLHAASWRLIDCDDKLATSLCEREHSQFAQLVRIWSSKALPPLTTWDDLRASAAVCSRAQNHETNAR